MISIPLTLICIVLLGCCANYIYLPALKRERATGDFTLYPLSKRVWIFRGYFSNSAVFAFNNSVVVVDSQISPLAAQRMKKLIQQHIGLPIRYVINTHHHGDHTGGNGEFPEAKIMATQKTVEVSKLRDSHRNQYTKTFGIAFQHMHETVHPTIGFVDKHILNIDGEELHLLQIGESETDDCCVVWWPQENALAVGDGVPTVDYPFMGTPFLDEGLKNNGEWIRFLSNALALSPKILVPGHGPALVGHKKIFSRITLLQSLFTDLLNTTNKYMHLPVNKIVSKVNKDLSHYRQNPKLKERTLSQRFAIYRCINSLDDSRRGKGWWFDLRPSLINIIPKSALENDEHISFDKPFYEIRAVALRMIAKKKYDEAYSLVHHFSQEQEDRSNSLALLAEVCLRSVPKAEVRIDGSEYIALAYRLSQEALQYGDSDSALFIKCIIEILGGIVLAQDLKRPVSSLELLVERKSLEKSQKRIAYFFLAKAYDYQEDQKLSSRHLGRCLPWALRPISVFLQPWIGVVL